MGAGLGDASTIQNEDAVGPADGGEAMGHDEAGTVAHEPFQRALQACLGDGVDAGGGFVENEDGRIGQHGAGEADDLPLPEGEPGTTLAHHRVEALRHRLDEIEAVERANRFDDGRIARFGSAKTDIVPHRAGKQEVVLQNHAEVPAQAGRAESPHVHAVEKNLPGDRQVELAEEVDDGALARAGVADEGDGLARLGGEADVVQHRAGRHVMETDVAELHPATQLRAVAGVVVVLPVGRGIEHAEDPLGAGEGGQCRAELPADGRDGRKEEVGEEEEGDEVAHFHGQRRAEHAQPAHHHNDGYEDLRVELKQRQVDRDVAGQSHVVAAVVGDELTEQAGVDLLPGEALGDLDALDALRHRGGDPGKTFLKHAAGPTDPFVEVLVDGVDRRGHEQDDEEKPPVVPGHENAAAQHLPELDDGNEEHVLRTHAQGLHVAGDAAEDAAQAGPPEVRDRQAHEVAENRVAQVVDHVFTQFQGPALAEVHGHLRPDREGGEAGRPEKDAVAVVAADGPVDDRPNGPSQRRNLHGAEDDRGKQPVALGGVGTGPREKAAEKRQVQLAGGPLLILPALRPGQREVVPDLLAEPFDLDLHPLDAFVFGFLRHRAAPPYACDSAPAAPCSPGRPTDAPRPCGRGLLPS